MAEVLAEHRYMYGAHLGTRRVEHCSCGWQTTPDTEQKSWEALAAHQAEELAANGHGKLEDAKAAALREAARELMNVNEPASRMPGIRFAVGFLAGQRRPE